MKVVSNKQNNVIGFINAGKDSTLEEVLEAIQAEECYIELAELTDKETGELRTVAFIKQG